MHGKVTLPLMVVKREGVSLAHRTRLAAGNQPEMKKDFSKYYLWNTSSSEGTQESFKPGQKQKFVEDAAFNPTFCKARRIPYGLRERVEDQLKR